MPTGCVMCSYDFGWIKEWQQMHPKIKNEKLKSTPLGITKEKILVLVTIGIKIILSFGQT